MFIGLGENKNKGLKTFLQLSIILFLFIRSIKFYYSSFMTHGKGRILSCNCVDKSQRWDRLSTHTRKQFSGSVHIL